MDNTAMTIVLSILGVLGTAMVTLIGNFLLKAIQDHSKLTKENNVQLAVLNTQILRIIEDTKSIPKIQADLNTLYQWKKQVEKKDD